LRSTGALRIVEKADSGEPVARWRALRDRIHDDVCRQGFDARSRRYRPARGSFCRAVWLADNWALVGRHAEARELFERLLVLRNDVGLLSEEYDVKRRRLVGNFPQAFSHVSLINTALNLTPRQDSPARSRLISTRPVRCKTATP
jgi:GH15 family glucan-1,4-alpha-glucosidase